jgi:hypothetical protein
MLTFPNLELAPNRSLTSEKKGLRILAFPAEFERAEILVPWPFRHGWLRFHPHAELIQVLQADIAVVYALD